MFHWDPGQLRDRTFVCQRCTVDDQTLFPVVPTDLLWRLCAFVSTCNLRPSSSLSRWSVGNFLKEVEHMFVKGVETTESVVSQKNLTAIRKFVHITRRILKTAFSLWERIECFLYTLGHNNFKMQQLPVILDFCFRKTHIWKATFSKCLLSTRSNLFTGILSPISL